jgi:hypothetical protein
MVIIVAVEYTEGIKHNAWRTKIQSMPNRISNLALGCFDCRVTRINCQIGGLLIAEIELNFFLVAFKANTLTKKPDCMKRDFSNFIGKMNEKYTFVGIVSFQPSYNYFDLFFAVVGGC